MAYVLVAGAVLRVIILVVVYICHDAMGAMAEARQSEPGGQNVTQPHRRHRACE